MTFDEALLEMRKGKRVRRPIWTRAFLFIGKEVDNLTEHICCGTFDSDRIYKIKAIECSNIMSKDWEII